MSNTSIVNAFDRMWQHTITEIDSRLDDIGSSNLIVNTSAPTTTTEGKLGQFYWDSTNQILYMCVSASNTYTWVIISTGIAHPAPAHGKGTEDLVAGVTPLADGQAYFVYE